MGSAGLIITAGHFTDGGSWSACWRRVAGALTHLDEIRRVLVNAEPRQAVLAASAGRYRPVAGGVRSPRMGREPAHRIQIDRDYEALRIGMHALFSHLGVAASTPAT